MTNPTVCLRCEKPIEWLGQNFDDLPKEAVIFISFGNYGSRVFDQIHGEYVVIVICDECMRAAGIHIQVRKDKRPRAEVTELGTFSEWAIRDNMI